MTKEKITEMNSDELENKYKQFSFERLIPLIIKGINEVMLSQGITYQEDVTIIFDPFAADGRLVFVHGSDNFDKDDIFYTINMVGADFAEYAMLAKRLDEEQKRNIKNDMYNLFLCIAKSTEKYFLKKNIEVYYSFYFGTSLWVPIYRPA